MSNFILVEHDAKRAGKHLDLRFEMPNSKLWASFVIKTIPKEENLKVLAIKTNNHNKQNALYTGTIKSGYGAGTLKREDGGKCNIIKYSNNQITIDFKGSILKGIYHLIFIGVIRKRKNGKQKKYLFFKGKIETKK